MAGWVFESGPPPLTFVVCQTGALGRQILDLTVVFIPLRSEKPPHPHLCFTCLCSLSGLKLLPHSHDPRGREGVNQTAPAVVNCPYEEPEKYLHTYKGQV